MKKIPEDPSTVAAVKAWRKMPRARRRAAWKLANKIRGYTLDPHASVDDKAEFRDLRRDPRAPWQTLPLPTALQRHVLSGCAHPHSQKTRAISLGFNRDQRRAMLAKKGSRTMTTTGWKSLPTRVESIHGRLRVRRARWERPTSTWSGTWNKWALRLEFNRRLRAHAEEYRRLNSLPKRVGRRLLAYLGLPLYMLQLVLDWIRNIWRPKNVWKMRRDR